MQPNICKNVYICIKPKTKYIMKKVLQISFLAFCLAFFSNTANAGTVSIDTTNQSQFAGPCNFAQGVRISLNGTATGYPLFDTMTVQIAYGDGTFDTTLSLIDSNDTYFAFFSHTYSSAGLYTLQFIATASDGVKDTLVLPNAIVYADTCGNINGQVYLDENSDCIFNGSDEAIYGKRVDAIQGGSIIASDWTDSSGNYSILVPATGSYSVELNYDNGFTYICPSGGSHNVTSVPSSGNDFALDCTPGFDLYGNAFGGSVPGQTRRLYVNTFNSFCQDTSGTVKIIFTDSLFSYAGSPSLTPSVVNGDTVEWNFTGLNNNGYNSFDISFNTYTDTTAMIGDTVCFTYMVTPIIGDSNMANNNVQVCIPVRTSYDPNIKEVQPIGVGDSGKVLPNTDLTYTIHFQNTGTAPAYNVYILDTIDTGVLDESTINISGASDPMVVNMISPSQNVIKFRFDNINLPDSTTNEPESHGWVTYTIQQQPSLPNGTVIRNGAAIYFDYNPPVLTPRTLNVIDAKLVSIKSIGGQSSQFATIFPNPARNILNIQFNESSSTQLKLMSIDGKLIREETTVNKNTQINVSDLNPGIYLLEIRNNTGQRQLSKLMITK